jgi:hypothetical protein
MVNRALEPMNRTVFLIVWFLVYVVGGAVLLSRFLLGHEDRIPFYAPLLIFAWVTGFFAGHSLARHIP